MKKRRLLTNILYVVILLALAGFLYVEFALLNNGEGEQKWLAGVALGVAVVAVALVEIVFPVVDNKDLFKMKKYVALTIAKTVLYIASVVALFLYLPFAIIPMKVSMIIFVILYFAQFFISLDPKVAKTQRKDEIDDADEISDDDTVKEENDDQ